MVANITFDRFEGGIDLRKGNSVSDANRMQEMVDAYVTSGLAVRKRPGLVKVTTLEPGTKGLFAAFGRLHTFYGQGTLTHADSRFVAHKVAYSKGEQAVKEVWFADVFNAFIYTAIEYADGAVEHHYLDGTEPTHIADENCPNAKEVIKAASKLFASHGDTVRYCATGKPRDWSTANDAGFLPTGLNFHGDRAVNALGLYRNNLVAFARDGAQIWQADPDPSAMRLIDRVENAGTNFSRTVVNVGGDLYFLSDYGFRSITTLQYTNNLADVDVGSPIDTLVQPHTRRPAAIPRAVYYYGSGQYLCALGNQLFVYSHSRTAKIAAWSRYLFPFEVDAFAELAGVLYVRHHDDIYRLSDEVTTDAGAPFEALIELPYLDFKAPGQRKRILGADVVIDGECELSLGFDVRYPSAHTLPLRVRGNSRAGGMLALDACGTEFSLRLRNASHKPFRLDAITLYYEVLGRI